MRSIWVWVEIQDGQELIAKIGLKVDKADEAMHALYDFYSGLGHMPWTARTVPAK